MSEKFYTAKEMAVAALKKYQELCENKDLSKANTSHEIEGGEEPNIEDAECPEQLAAEGTVGISSKPKKKNPDGSDSEEDEVSEGESQAMEESAKEEVGEHEDEMHEEKEKSEESEESEEPEESEESEKSEEPKKENKKPAFMKSEAASVKPLKKFIEKMEMKKAIVDEGKSDSDKVKSRSERGNHSISKKIYGQDIGINKPISEKGGVSHVGHSLKVGKKLLPGSSKDIEHDAKKYHKGVISEQKGMKKPSLPKSEEMNKSSKVEQFLGVEKK